MLFAGAVIIKNGKVLLVQESHDEACGLWSLPIGSVEINETIEDAAIREVQEETGYIVALGHKQVLIMTGAKLKSLPAFHSEEINLTIFQASVVSGKLLPGEDVMDAKWYPLTELDRLALRGDWVKNIAENLS